MNLKKAAITAGISGNKKLTGIEDKRFSKKYTIFHHLLCLYVLVTQAATPRIPLRSSCQANAVEMVPFQARLAHNRFSGAGIAMANLTNPNSEIFLHRDNVFHKFPCINGKIVS